ncbi:MAG TPA: hypothetical protein VMT55_06335 [Candidatus Sulfotelmatobacter sp.]|nr:hypothetical protein [Candidatus Sulfotelmatobacter sp.]
MKKIAILIILACFSLGCAVPAPAAVKKTVTVKKTAKTTVKKKIRKKPVRRLGISRYLHMKGPRPVFPKDAGVAAAPAPPPPPPPKPLPPPVPVKPAQTRNWIPKAGFSGGALMLGIDYRVAPMWDSVDLLAGVGYGFGNNYSVLAVTAGGACQVKDNYYVGASLDLANYSQSGSGFNAGTALGIGVFGGTVLHDKWQLQAGYSSALGLNARVGYIL